MALDVRELVRLVDRLRDERRGRGALGELRVVAHVLAGDAQRALQVTVVAVEHPRHHHLEHLAVATARGRSEEHTSELQSRRDLVCRLLLEKKKQKRNTRMT